MNSSCSGSLVRTEAGCRLSGRPYYPFLAANGTDAILIGPGGFPDDPNWRRYSMQLPLHASLGWFKTARKDFLYANPRHGVPSSGTSVALAAPTTLLGVGCERNLALRRPEQVVDPQARVLTSTFEVEESRGGTPAKIRVTTFLTKDHLLVERYEVLQAPESGLRLGFQLDTPNAHSLYELCVHPESITFETPGSGFRFAYRYASPEIPDGVAASWCDAPQTKIEWEAGRPTVEWTNFLSVGETVTHYVAVVDACDAPDVGLSLESLQARTRTGGYEEIYRHHCAQGGAVAGRAKVSLPEKDLEYLYDYSHMVLDGAFDADSGFLPMGILAGSWQNVMFWDSWFASMAWLGSNMEEKAKKMAAFYEGHLGEACGLAARMHTPGARYAWTTSREHFEQNPERVQQFHNNAVIALQALQVFQFGGDTAFLAKSLDGMEQALLFLTEKLVQVEDGRASLRPCAGLDESTADLKGTDTWTAAVYAAAMQGYQDACRQLDHIPFRPDGDAIITLVRDALDRNVDAHGVLQSFVGGKSPHWGSLIFHLFPDHPAKAATLAALSRYDAGLDSYYSHGVVGYWCRIFTWTEFWIARLLAADESGDGWSRLRQCAKFTDGFGSIPERVLEHGELLKQPFLTAHAAYLWAVNSLLVNRRGARLAVLTNLPPGWSEVTLENLTTPDGLRISAELRGGTIERLEITNLHREAREIELAVAGGVGRKFCLAAGETFHLDVGGQPDEPE